MSKKSKAACAARWREKRNFVSKFSPKCYTATFESSCVESPHYWPLIVIEKIKGVSRVQKPGFGFTQAKVCYCLSRFKLVFSSANLWCVHYMESVLAFLPLHFMCMGCILASNNPCFFWKLVRLSFNMGVEEGVGVWERGSFHTLKDDDYWTEIIRISRQVFFPRSQLIGQVTITKKLLRRKWGTELVTT